LSLELFNAFQNKSLDASNFTSYDQLSSETYGEFCFYKYIDHPDKDAELVTATDIKAAIDYFNANNVKNVVLHYGHYFNADYDALFSHLHYFKSWFDGNLFVFSPEEIVFLAIMGNKDVDDVIEKLASEGFKHILGFLPDSIADSKYYADDDELFIEDRHVILDKLRDKGLSFIYPFNIGQAETIEEFQEMIDYVNTRDINEIILQPAKLIDTDEDFDYMQGQCVMKALDYDFLLPQRAISETATFFTDKSFEILFKFVHI
jgi:hypothetical protein